MLTIFTCPKPFKGHIATIQHNAIKSWQCLKGAPDIVLFGGEVGMAEVAAELGVQHISDVTTSPQGTPYVNECFARAERMSQSPFLCYANTDIILLNDFIDALQTVSSRFSCFLLVGQRRNLDISERLSFDGNWQTALRLRAEREGELFGPIGIDYFAFPRGVLGKLPSFIIGRAAWDNYMIFHALKSRIPLVDVTPSALAIHQNHDYSHHPEGRAGTYVTGEEAIHNRQLYNSLTRQYIFLLDEATHTLRANKVMRNTIHLPLRQRLKRMGALHPGSYALSLFLVRIVDASLRRWRAIESRLSWVARRMPDD